MIDLRYLAGLWAKSILCWLDLHKWHYINRYFELPRDKPLGRTCSNCGTVQRWVKHEASGVAWWVDSDEKTTPRSGDTGGNKATGS